MIPLDIQSMLSAKGYSVRSDDKEEILNTLAALGIDPDSQLGSFYLEYNPVFLKSKQSFEQLEDVTSPSEEGHVPVQVDPWDTPVGMTTRFIREVWELPSNLICLTSTEGEGGYIYDLKTGVVYDFDLAEQSLLAEGRLSPRWGSFFEFIKWYIE